MISRVPTERLPGILRRTPSSRRLAVEIPHAATFNQEALEEDITEISSFVVAISQPRRRIIT